jgi:hypothetical protein
VGNYGSLGISAASNAPGSKQESITWITSDGNLLLFGGFGYGIATPEGRFNDLWQYKLSTNQWTWISGNYTKNVNGVYGTKGTPSSSNVPGSRSSAVSWLDLQGNLWLFGGLGYDYSSQTTGQLNDLWCFNMTTKEWAWITGLRTALAVGVYSKSTPSSSTAGPASVPMSVPTIVVPTPYDSPIRNPNGNVTSPTTSNDITPTVVPAVIVPVVVVTVGLVVLIVLMKKRQQKRKQEVAMTALTPNALDSRLIDYNLITIKEQIGAGSYGKVHIGKYRSTTVAIKVGNNLISPEEFASEADFQLKIPPHPNIVQLLGISSNGPQQLVILEYCNGGSLDKLLFDSDSTISPKQQIFLASGIATGLVHLHGNNIVHRDLAARNILLHNGEPKISDFGMSRKLKEEAQVGKTATNIGPLRWMAPESLGNQTYSKKSDVWTFGIVLYEIISRKEPHITEDILQIGAKIRDEGITPKIPADCPPLLKQLMEMCWKINPKDRPDMEVICELFQLGT